MNPKNVTTIFQGASELPPVKQNNFLNKSSSIIAQFKYLIFVESLIGINRLYLYQQNKIVLWLSYIYVPVLAVTASFIMLQGKILSDSHLVLRNTVCIEYAVLVFTSALISKKKLHKLLQNIETFDERLNIIDDVTIIDVRKRTLFWITASVSYCLAEYLVLAFFIKGKNFENLSYIFFYMMSLAHDTEQIFYFTFLRIIYTRLVILKAHITKFFLTNEDKKIKWNKIETLSNKVQLDNDSLHEMYELLHKCSGQLNNVMSFPMLIMVCTSGLSTTILLKIIFRMTQLYNRMNPNVVITVIIYLLIRSAKYTMLVIVPCYYSSIISDQVSTIRTIVHDAAYTMTFDKLERRKIKAFSLLTKENEFTYTIGGVIKLNMTLPMSFLSLCTTYLVIIIQFSKFFD